VAHFFSAVVYLLIIMVNFVNKSGTSSPLSEDYTTSLLLQER